MAGLELEKRLLQGVSAEEMQRHLEVLCAIDRTSGTEGEFRAVEYLADVLRGYGMEPVVHEFDAYLSYPVAGGLTVVSGPGVEGPEEIRAKTRAFAGNTPPEGVEGELVYVPGGKDMFRDMETHKRLADLDLRGKVVISEGGGRQNMIMAQERGAAAYIHMWPSDEDYIHEGIVTPVWGTPTPETFHLIPDIPVISITHDDGAALVKRVEQGPVRVRVSSRTETGWARQKMLEVNVPGNTDEYVLAAGHIDSWHLGATDNATGNVSCLELARVFHQQRDHLQRGLRVVWWTGHSTGRYAGSAWYADHFWHDLHENCVLYINIDSPGSLGATVYDVITAMAETAELGVQTVQDVAGQKPEWERPLRAGDQSFWGIGIPSLFMLLSNRPEGQRWRVGGSGMGWWWHTEEDTIDKVDLDVLVLDTQIYAAAAWRTCTADRLPLDAAAAAREIGDVARALQREAEDAFDLSSVVEEAAALAEELDRLRKAGDAAEWNRVALGVLRTLMPLNYTRTGPFDHDLAVPAQPLPVLQPVLDLARLEEGSDEHKFLSARLVRERNKVVAGLRAAGQLIPGGSGTSSKN